MLFLFVLHYFRGINKITLKKKMCACACVCVLKMNYHWHLLQPFSIEIFHSWYRTGYLLIFLFFISVTRMSKSMITSNPHIRLHAGYNNSEI